MTVTRVRSGGAARKAPAMEPPRQILDVPVDLAAWFTRNCHACARLEAGWCPGCTATLEVRASQGVAA